MRLRRRFQATRAQTTRWRSRPDLQHGGQVTFSWFSTPAPSPARGPASRARGRGSSYDVTGPELLSADDLARLYAAAGDSPVTAEDLDDDAFVAGLQAAGLPPEVAGLLASFGTAIRGGHLDQHATTVQDFTGRPPRSVSQVLADAL